MLNLHEAAPPASQHAAIYIARRKPVHQNDQTSNPPEKLISSALSQTQSPKGPASPLTPQSICHVVEADIVCIERVLELWLQDINVEVDLGHVAHRQTYLLFLHCFIVDVQTVQTIA